MKKAGNANGESTISNDGVEVVSPIMRGKNIEDSKSIKRVCERLNGFGQYISDDCGFHVHIGADYLYNNNSWINFVELIANTEKIIYTISNKVGEIPKLDRMQYIKPLSGNIQKNLKDKNLKIEQISDVKKLLKVSQDDNEKQLTLNEKRYYGINFLNVDENKNTIEFRMSNGTLDYETIIDNIEIYGGLIKAARNLAKIQDIKKEERTEKQKKAIQIFSRIKNNDISEEEKAKLLLSLIVPPEKKDIFYNRYIENNKLIEKDKQVKKIIDENVVRGSINLSEYRIREQQNSEIEK